MTDQEFEHSMKHFAASWFFAGFRLSGEGFNGEYPFEYDTAKIWDDIGPSFEQSYKKMLDAKPAS